MAVELHLISSSTSNGLPATGLDLTVAIPKEIQVLREWAIWHQDITPFRDRLMISKMREVSVVEKELKQIMDNINEELRKCSYKITEQNPCPVVSVGISSSPRAPQASMCYVEALYEEYQFRPPFKHINLSVRREHKEMEALRTKEPAKGKKFVWQHTRLPMSLMQKFPDLTLPRLWSCFPYHVSKMIEQEFRNNPFNSKLDLPQSKSTGKCILNFESGEMYSTSEKKIYKIRCTMTEVENFVTCRLLGESSYRSLAKHYQGAGILFYTFHTVIQEPIFLLGHMTYSSRCWSDFGGLKNFRERPKATAARECYEETLGVIGDKQTLVEMLTNYKDNNAFKVVNENSDFVEHFVRISYQDYPGYFRKARSGPREDWEVDDMKWFSLSSLRGAVKAFTTQQSVVVAYPILENGNLDILSPCPLRYELLQTLCIAEKLKFLHFIKQICKQLHIQQLLKSESETQLHDSAETEPNPREQVPPKDRMVTTTTSSTSTNTMDTTEAQERTIPPKDSIKPAIGDGMAKMGLDTAGSHHQGVSVGGAARLEREASEDAEEDEEEGREGGKGGVDEVGDDGVDEVERIRQLFKKCEDKTILYGMGSGIFKW